MGNNEMLLTPEYLDKCLGELQKSNGYTNYHVPQFVTQPLWSEAKITFAPYGPTVKLLEEPCIGPPEEWEDEQRVQVEAVLRRSLALLRRGWVRGQGAAREDGVPVRPGDERAARWCAVGAVHRATTDLGLDSTYSLANGLLRLVAGVRCVENWNDGQPSVDSVLRLFETAIRRVALPK